MFLVGCDPEIIPVDANEKPRSIVGLLGGTKEKPRRLCYGSVQEDNVNAEIGIDPAWTFPDFNIRIRGILGELAAELRKSKLFISTLVSANFPREELTGDTLISGCNPDFDAWSLDMNIPPSLGETTLRSAGGHVHLHIPSFSGYKPITEKIDDIGAHCTPNRDTDDPMVGIYLVRALDYRLGVQSVILDSDTKRKALYGKAGCFRPKPYGIEYRTLSNFWIFREESRRWLWRELHTVVSNFMTWKLEPDSKLGEDIVQCINNNDILLAGKLIQDYKVPAHRLAA